MKADGIGAPAEVQLVPPAALRSQPQPAVGVHRPRMADQAEHGQIADPVPICVRMGEVHPVRLGEAAHGLGLGPTVAERHLAGVVTGDDLGVGGHHPIRAQEVAESGDQLPGRGGDQEDEVAAAPVPIHEPERLGVDARGHHAGDGLGGHAADRRHVQAADRLAHGDDRLAHLCLGEAASAELEAAHRCAERGPPGDQTGATHGAGEGQHGGATNHGAVDIEEGRDLPGQGGGGRGLPMARSEYHDPPMQTRIPAASRQRTSTAPPAGRAADTARGVAAAELLREARALLRASPAIDHWHQAIAREDAEDLLALALRVDVEVLDRRLAVPPAARRRFRGYIARRAEGEPVALIRGWVDFDGLTLGVRKGVFVPRNSSETLARQALALLRRRQLPVAVDVACGAGPVACLIAARIGAAQVWGLDIDAAAVALARANARRLHLANARFRVSDLLSALPGRLRGEVAAITMHPPYVGRGDVRALPREVRGFEPRHTLTDGSPDGLGLVRDLLGEAPPWLRPGGAVLVEVAPYLSRSVQALMRHRGLEVAVFPDPAGLTRVIRGRWRSR